MLHVLSGLPLGRIAKVIVCPPGREALTRHVRLCHPPGGTSIN
jgi:hypothetical protein